MIEHIKAKLRTKSFWVALIGALTLILSRLGCADAGELAETIAEGIGGILLVFGIIGSPVATDKIEPQDEDSQTKE